jgi:hypothetical protein
MITKKRADGGLGGYMLPAENPVCGHRQNDREACKNDYHDQSDLRSAKGGRGQRSVSPP